MADIYKSEKGRESILARYREILDAWPIAKTEHHVPTSYGSTFVIECGAEEKPPLILLHGSVSNSFTWIGDVETFTKTHRVFAIDLIGEAGFSDPERPTYESGAYPLWLAEVFDHFGLNQVSLLGMSLGGWMAISFASRFPERVSHLSLICPGGIAPTRASFLFKALFYSFFGKWGQKKIFESVNSGVVAESGPGPSTGPVTGPAKGPGLGEALAFVALISRHFRPRMEKLLVFSDEDLDRLTMPVQVIFGEKDALIPARRSVNRLRQHAPNLQATLLPETGHIITNQRHTVVRFLQPG